MDSRNAQVCLTSPEVVATSALSGVISGPGAYQVSVDWSSVNYGFGTGAERTRENDLAGLIQQMESLIDRVESADSTSSKPAVKTLTGLPRLISGEIIFSDVGNLDTDGIYPRKLTYQDNVSKGGMARACFPSTPSSAEAAERQPTRRIGWTLTWDVKRSVVEVRGGK